MRLKKRDKPARFLECLSISDAPLIIEENSALVGVKRYV